ncbi:GntR family transcriptional regulator [Paenibacillus lignilyticus]|uniref:GntR family transcriptional regulator n=1 Tax=Paenibacillus lignilyticus TaxID=1172615 RepID=A0ABS5C9J6_9BACL|nr:GntR family transcriptional regulator [Paenibacillus lignilyticus]MBP3962677.1 GntR family transcriptional regulator [Paenibacillus lignilyticus]
MTRINSDSKVPLYVQIKEKILGDIQSGLLKPGEAIPPESLLSETYSVSRATIRQAVTELVFAGFLQRQQGRGTFVNKPKIETGLRNLYSFFQDMTSRGMRPESRVIEFEIVLPKADVRAKLNLPENTLVVKLIRLRLADDEIQMLETTFLPLELYPGLTQEDVITCNSLYSLLENKFSVSLDHVVEYFEPVLVDDFASKMLEVPKGSPALYIERVGYLQDNRLAELSQSIVRGDRCRYYVELVRKKED